MTSEPFWLDPRTVTLKDGTVVTLRPEEAGDLELTWAMFSTLSEDTLEFLPIHFSRDQVEGHLRMNYFNHVLNAYCDEYKMGLLLD